MSLSEEQYVDALADLLSGDPARVRAANRTIFTASVQSARMSSSVTQTHRLADVVLAKAAGRE